MSGILRSATAIRYLAWLAPCGMKLVYVPAEVTMNVLNNPLFWSMKIKIAILTLATFVALC
jgi:hypothetical protein